MIKRNFGQNIHFSSGVFVKVIHTHLKLVVFTVFAKTQVKPDFLAGDHVTVDADLS